MLLDSNKDGQKLEAMRIIIGVSDHNLRASCLMLEIKEFRCYEAKIEESEKSTCRIVMAGGCPVAVAQWQSTSGTSQVSWVRLPVAAGLFHFPLFSPHNV